MCGWVMSSVVGGAGAGVSRSVSRGHLLRGTGLAGLIAAGIVSTAVVPGPAQAQTILPEGGTVTAGAATIGPSSPNSLLITQTSPTAIIEWQGFSVGGTATAHFDNGAGATLNRVTGNDPSLIAGTLSATGSLYLINPAGVTVGPGGKVMTGGSFVASTHDVSDADFLTQGAMTFAGSSKGEIVNHGMIRSPVPHLAPCTSVASRRSPASRLST